MSEATLPTAQRLGRYGILRRAYVVAILSFAAKGLFAFVITYQLANALSADDLALWGVMLSFGTILSVADVGVGQLVLTSLHEQTLDSPSERRLIGNAVGSVALLSALVWIGTVLILDWRHVIERVRWRDLLIAIILLRLLLIPSSAYLMALERYHERKVAEAVTYLAALLFVLWAVRNGDDISTLLLGVNSILTLGAIAVAGRAWALGMPRPSMSDVSAGGIRRVFQGAFPYFVNNVSGLAIYGGFIALSAPVLRSADLARLSLLHTVLFMHAYQVFELVFRQVQPRMYQPETMKRVRLLVLVSFVVTMLGVLAVGVPIASLLFRKYTFSVPELLAYTVFVFLEIYYLMATSRLQMRSALKHLLQWLSIGKLAGFIGALSVYAMIPGPPTLLGFSTALTIFSMVTSAAAWRVDQEIPTSAR